MPRYPFKSCWKRWLAGFFDGLGRVLFFPLRSSRKPLDLTAVRRILVIRLDHIGDVVMSRPAIRALHKKFPHAVIDLLVTEDIAPLFESSKEIRTVITARHGWFNRNASFAQKWAEFWRLVGILKAGSYDLGIDLRGDLRNILLMRFAGVKHAIGYGVAGGGFLLHEEIPHDATRHQVLLNLELLRSFHIAQNHTLPPFEYSPESAQKFRGKTGMLPPKTLLPRIAVHMGSGYPSKRWPSENFRALIREIDRQAIAQIVLLGTEAEKNDMPLCYPCPDSVIPAQAGIQAGVNPGRDLHPAESVDPSSGGQNGSLLEKKNGGSGPPTKAFGGDKSYRFGNDILSETLKSERLIDLRGKTELRDLPALLDVCDIFIGNDSGPAHIAAAQGLEILILASGTNDIRLWHPWTQRRSLLRHEVPCAPCALEICPVEGHPCVDAITVDQVLNALRPVLGRFQKRA